MITQAGRTMSALGGSTTAERGKKGLHTGIQPSCIFDQGRYKNFTYKSHEHVASVASLYGRRTRIEASCLQSKLDRVQLESDWHQSMTAETFCIVKSRC